MLCITPKRIPLRELRGAYPKGTKEARALREVPCRKCHGCREAARMTMAHRIAWQWRDSGSAYFITPTYSDDDLPMTEAREPGELTDAQRALFVRWESLERRSPAEIERHEALMLAAAQGSEPLPTLGAAYLQRFKKRMRKALGYNPLQVWAGEYGSHFGRPHWHGIIYAIDHREAQAIADCWPHGICHVTPVNSEGIAGYVAKDASKGVHYREKFVAQGREAPRFLYPQRPYLAAGQQQWVREVLGKYRSHVDANDFWFNFYVNGIGRKFRHEGKQKRIGLTAYRKAAEEVLQDMDSAEDVAYRGYWKSEARQLAAQHCRLLDPMDSDFSQEYSAAYEKRLKRARYTSDRAKKRHREILGRRGIRHEE